MHLGDLIRRLEAAPQDKVLPLGFNNPHSYRGYYEQLAFEPARDIKVSEVLEAAKSALGKTFRGYKGGEYTMRENTECWIASFGNVGEEIGYYLLTYMLGEEP